MGWWRRLLYRQLIRSTAWALRHEVTTDKMRDMLARSFGHRPPQWREDVLEQALAVNRSRLMARINA